MSIDVEATRCDGTLTIDGVMLHREAFAVLDVSPLLGGPPQRGADTTIPGRPGVLSNPRRADARTVALRMVIDGRYQPDGDPAPDPGSQLWATVDYLGTYVADPTYTGDGTRTATLVTRDGRTLQGQVTVEGLRLGDRSGPVARAALQVTIPAGRLVEVP